MKRTRKSNLKFFGIEISLRLGVPTAKLSWTPQQTKMSILKNRKVDFPGLLR